MDESGEEYQAIARELSEEEGYWKGEWQGAQDEISGQTRDIRATKQAILGRLYDMGDATAQKDEALAQSSKEIVGMLVQEAADHIEEKMEENAEKAKENAQEKDEEEKKAEEAREEKKQLEKEIEGLTEERRMAQGTGSPVPASDQGAQDLAGKQFAVLQNTREILEEQNLLEEEIKGIVVDSML